MLAGAPAAGRVELWAVFPEVGEGGHKKDTAVNTQNRRRPRDATPPLALPPLALAACCCALGWTRPLLLVGKGRFHGEGECCCDKGRACVPASPDAPTQTKVVRHLSKNPIPGKTGIQSKIPLVVSHQFKLKLPWW